MAQCVVVASGKKPSIEQSTRDTGKYNNNNTFFHIFRESQRHTDTNVERHHGTPITFSQWIMYSSIDNVFIWCVLCSFSHCSPDSLFILCLFFRLSHFPHSRCSYLQATHDKLNYNTIISSISHSTDETLESLLLICAH